MDQFNFISNTFKKSELNYTIILRKKRREYLGHPYSNKCIKYKDNGQPFEPNSHIQCYRQCIREYTKKHKNCVPFFIDNLIHEKDFISDDTEVCPQEYGLDSYQLELKSKISQKCLDLCPKDCLNVEYSSYLRKPEIHFGTKQLYAIPFNERTFEKRLIWDTSQPMLSYKEEPIMLFTDYLIYCGGLMSIWFGTSAKDLFILIIESRIWRLIWDKVNICRFQTSVVEIQLQQLNQ